MQALRPVLRRQARLGLQIRCTARFQHDQYGPHKEYFQNPNQTPLPDTTPFNKPQVPAQAYTQHNYDAHVALSPPAQSSRTVRALRSALWATVFGLVGLVAGTSLITWEYMQPPYPPGSPEQEDLFSSILEMMDTHPLTEGLRQDRWIEEDFYQLKPPGNGDHGLSMVREKLTGPEGIVIKAYKHPILKWTILVLFTGFGIEGWPDTVHGGIISSLLLEGVHQHINNFYDDHNFADHELIDVDFKAPVRPGEIYAVLVPPANFEILHPDVPCLDFKTLLMRLDSAPKLGLQHDPATNMEIHTVEIHAPDGVDVTHATAQHRRALVLDPAQHTAGEPLPGWMKMSIMLPPQTNNEKPR